MNVSISRAICKFTLVGAALSLSLPALAHTVLWGSSSEGKNPGSIFTIDATTGKAELVGPSGLGDEISDIAVDPSTGTLYGILGSACTGATLITIDQESGEASVVGVIEGEGFSGSGEASKKHKKKSKSKHGSATNNSGKDKQPDGNGKGKGECPGGSDALAFGLDGTLYVGGWNGGTHGGKILTVDKTSGAVLKNVEIESVQGSPAYLAGMATSPDGSIWVSHGANVQAKLRIIDPDTGHFTSTLGLKDKKAVISDLAFDDDGVLYGAMIEIGKLVSIKTTGHHAGKIEFIGHFGHHLQISGLALLGVEVLAADCVGGDGCNPTGGQTIQLPPNVSGPTDASIVQKQLKFTDPRVAAGTCGKENLTLFQDDPAVPDLVIPKYLCGSPEFVVLRTESELFLDQGTIVTTNEPGQYFDNPLSCDDHITGDPQQQDVMVWQTTDRDDLTERHALELTFECGSSRGRTRGLSYFVIGMHIDFGVDWYSNPWKVRSKFIDLTEEKLHYLTLAVINAKPALSKHDYAKLQLKLGVARLAFAFRLYELASFEMSWFIKLLDQVHFKEEIDFNHHGDLEMRAYNARFMIDEKVIGIAH